MIERVTRSWTDTNRNYIPDCDLTNPLAQDFRSIGSDAWSRINFAFHLDTYRLANLPLRYEVISRLYHQLEPYSRFYVHSTHALGRVQCEHHEIVDALRASGFDEFDVALYHNKLLARRAKMLRDLKLN